MLAVGQLQSVAGLKAKIVDKLFYFLEGEDSVNKKRVIVNSPYITRDIQLNDGLKTLFGSVNMRSTTDERIRAEVKFYQRCLGDRLDKFVKENGKQGGDDEADRLFGVFVNTLKNEASEVRAFTQKVSDKLTFLFDMILSDVTALKVLTEMGMRLIKTNHQEAYILKGAFFNHIVSSIQQQGLAVIKSISLRDLLHSYLKQMPKFRSGELSLLTGGQWSPAPKFNIPLESLLNLDPNAIPKDVIPDPNPVSIGPISSSQSQVDVEQVSSAHEVVGGPALFPPVAMRRTKSSIANLDQLAKLQATDEGTQGLGINQSCLKLSPS